jgi:hypothetical protein
VLEQNSAELKANYHNNLIAKGSDPRRVNCNGTEIKGYEFWIASSGIPTKWYQNLLRCSRF